MSDAYDWDKEVGDFLAGPTISPPTGPTLRTNVGIAVESKVNADFEGELRQIARKTGVPVDAVRSEPDVAKRKLAETDPLLDDLPNLAPKTARYVTDNAAISHDDMPALAFVERRLQALGDLTKAAGAGFTEGMLGLSQSIRDSAVDLGSLLAFTPEQKAAFDRLQRNNAISDARVSMKEISDRFMPETSNVWEAGVNAGVVSLFQQGPGLLGAVVSRNPNVALSIMGAQVGGEAYGEAKDKGKSTPEALAYGSTQAAIEVITERLPVNALLGDVAAGSGFFKTLGKQLALDMPGEQVATVLQDLNEWATLNPEKPFTDYLRERPNAALQTAIATVVGGGGVVATAKIADMAVLHAEKARQATTAQVQGNVLAEMDAMAAESKLRARDPESFKAFIDQATEEGPVTNVYVSAEALADALAQSLEASGTAHETMAQLPSAQEQLAEALRTGGDVKIPIGEWTAYASGSELAQALTPYLKTDPAGMSQIEAQEFMQTSAEQLQADIARVVADGEQVDAFQSSADAVKANVAQQLASANRFTPDVNEAYASLMSSFYATNAARLGLTPEELYAAYPVQIAAQGVEAGALTQEAETPADFSARMVEAHDLRDFDLRETASGDLELNHIAAPTGQQGQGKGSAAMADLVAYADAQGKRIILTPQSRDDGKGKTSAKRLASFYKRFGFKENKGRSRDFSTTAGMIREPQTLKQGGALTQEESPEDAYIRAINPEGRRIAEDERPNLGMGDMYGMAPRGAREIARAENESLGTIRYVESGGNIYALAQNPDLGEEDVIGYAMDRGDGTELHVVNEAQGQGVGAELSFQYRSRRPNAPSGGLTAAGERTARRTYRRMVAEGVLAQSARGSYNPATDLITLLRGADLSTFLHEAGHFYLETLARIAASPDAPQDLQNDFAIAASFMGHDGMSAEAWLALPLDDRREGHELFARGFEAYLFEGKAPSSRLRALFQRFRSWLLSVYRDMTRLNVELSDEVRGVFDRMLATEAEISRNETAKGFNPLFRTAEEAGMTEAEWAGYQALGREATQDAVDQLEARSMRDMQWLSNARSRKLKELQRDADSKRKAIRAEVTAEVMAEPVNRARQLLKRGMLDGQEFDGPHKLSIPALKEMYEGLPPELRDYQRLGYGKYGMLAEEGVHPDEVAELFGYGSGDQMVEDLLNAPPAAEVIDGMTDQRMLERYGDLSDSESIQRAADEALHNDARLRFVATEANALAKATGQRRVLAAAAKDYAAQLVARQRVRDLRPSRYMAAETRAAIAAERAAAAGDLIGAATQKRNQLLNAYTARASQDAQAEIEKALRYFATFEAGGKRKTIDPDYRDQIDTLMDRFDLRRTVTLRALDKRRSLAEWAERQREMGFDPVIPEDLLNEANRKHYKDMTVEEMRGLVDSVRNIEHLGRLKNRLLTAKDQREFEATVLEAEALIRSNATRDAKVAVESNTWTDRVGAGAREFLAMHRKFSSIIRQMGGFTDGNLLWEVMVRPMNEAGDREASMREASTIELHKIFTPLIKEGNKLRQKLFIPEINQSLSLEGRLAIALNWGNVQNRDRVMDGDRWTEEQVQAVLRTLTPAQWQFVQDIWDNLDSYWPQIAAKERRVTGITPEKVEPLPFTATASDGSQIEMRGGYYPIKYDPNRSTRAEADNIADTIKQSMQGAYTRATTRRGHTKARVENVGRPVRKDFSVIFDHVTQVIHDLTWHEYLIDANRLLRAGGIDDAIRDHYGPETLRTMRKALEDMAAGEIPAQNVFERSVNHLRTGATVAGLGWNLTTALLQPLGLTQSAVRIGPKWVARGISRWIGDAAQFQNSVDWVNDRSEFMRLRSKTMQREINEIRNKVSGSKPAALTTVEESFFYMIAKMQLVADMPTWLGQYEKSMDLGETEDRAAALADQAVRDAQGSGYIADLAQIQRGSPLMKLWTNFYSYFNVTYNLLAESVNETRVAGPKRLPLLAADALMLLVVPSILGTVLKNAMRGDDWDDLPEELAKDQLGYLLGLMIGLREAGSMFAAPGGYSSLAGLRFLTETGKLVKQAEQGEVDEAFLKSANNAAGILFHYPAGQVQRTALGIQAMADGKSKNPLVLVTGPPPER